MWQDYYVQTVLKTLMKTSSKSDLSRSRMSRRTALKIVGAGAVVAAAAVVGGYTLQGPAQPSRAVDPLPSWNDGKTKEAILTFVQKVTDERSADFVPPAERIAVFDNDGTLWVEAPISVEGAFVIDRVKELEPQHPEWKDTQPFKAVLEGDMKTVTESGERGFLELAMGTHAGMTTNEFEQIVINWITKAQHPQFKRLYTDLAYAPMLELLSFLRANRFKTYIVSGGGAEFMRPWTDRIYGVPPEQVVGSTIVTKFQILNGKPVLMRLPEIDQIDDEEGKPVAINKFIGRRPIAAFGNSDGDLQMLQWTTSSAGIRLGLMVHHDDTEREYAYDKGAEKVLELAAGNNWIVASMKNDWKKIY